MRRLMIVIVVLAAFALGLLVRGGGESTSPAIGTDVHESEPTTWTCSMHPQIQLPEAGQCPICLMDLIPLETNTEEDLGPRTIVLTESAAALADIQTTPVRRADADGDIKVDVRMVGKIAYDETTYKTITAWIPGRIDTLLVDYTGMTVQAGQGLASLYSPELYAAQVELLDAVKAVEALSSSPDPAMQKSARATVTSARSRLGLWGLGDDQIRTIEQSGIATHHTRIPSPLGGVVVHKNAVEGQYVREGTKLFTIADLNRVWVSLDVYESDIALLSVGVPVDFTIAALPGRTFTGEVTFIDPVLNEKSRTVGVRIEVDNRDGMLKPGMFVHATAKVGIPPLEGQSGDGQDALVIPASAPMITGSRAVVYVKIPGREKPSFEGREIVLGIRAGDYYVVLSGLAEGEDVVVHGNFKLDSALQIQAKPSMMSPDGGVAPPGHNHGGMQGTEGMDESTSMPAKEPTPLADVPEAFRSQLKPLLDGYLAAQTAFAADDDVAARREIHNTMTALDAVDMGLAGPVHGSWMDDAAVLSAALKTMAAAKDITSRREGIQNLTDLIWGALIRYGYQDERTVRQFHCPMANDGVGGDWIQLDPVTSNPYYGAMMRKCGSETGVLASDSETDQEASR